MIPDFVQLLIQASPTLTPVLLLLYLSFKQLDRTAKLSEDVGEIYALRERLKMSFEQIEYLKDRIDSLEIENAHRKREVYAGHERLDKFKEEFICGKHS